MTPALQSVRVQELKEGDRVDLSTCPYLNEHPSAEWEYATVAMVEQETPTTTVIGYEGIDHVGYPLDTRLTILSRQ